MINQLSNSGGSKVLNVIMKLVLNIKKTSNQKIKPQINLINKRLELNMELPVKAERILNGSTLRSNSNNRIWDMA
jgi:hypothetical protein